MTAERAFDIEPEQPSPPAESVPLSTDDILARVETAILVVGHQGVLRYANRCAAELFGFDDPEQLRGRQFRDLGFAPDEDYKVQSLERRACRGRDWEGTLSIRRPDGTTLYIRMSAAPVRTPDGEHDGSVIIAKQAIQLGAESQTGTAERVGLFERIGTRLGSTLELDDTLQFVAETLVPQFADHCFIDLYDERDRGHGKNLKRAAQKSVRDWEPPDGNQVEPNEPVRYPKGHFCLRAINANETVLIEDVEDVEAIADAAGGDMTVAAVETVLASLDPGVTSVIAAPLTTRGLRLGVMCLALSSLTERDSRNYVPDDRDLVAAIASRVAIAVDNALLFAEERRTAVAFQGSLLPSKPPVLDGIEVAYSYVPAEPLESHGQGIQTQVGGDWYDIIPLSAGRVGIAIGDVQGRGATAAAIMGQLRSALRAFAMDDKEPADILRRLDDWCRAMAADRDDLVSDPMMVSCTYLIYDPWFRTVTIANAGHMPPLVVSGAGLRHLEVKHEGLLLGARDVGPPPGATLPTYREETIELPPGSTLIFYTDGLVDRRHRADGPGTYTDSEVYGMLSEAVLAVADEGVDRIVAAAERAVPGKIDDDMAILVVRTSPHNLPWWEVPYPAEPIRVSEARKMAFETFLKCGMDADQAEVACLLVSEVVTNVVLHTVRASARRGEFEFESAMLESAMFQPAMLESAMFGSAAASGGPAGQAMLPGAAGSAAGRWAHSSFAEQLGQADGTDFTLRIRKGESTVWVEVFDSDLRLPRIRVAGENDEGGRGLYLVEQLATRWGSRPTERGKAVWFEVPIRPATG